jgi:ubiquinone/menaquinone biosynthesis C-methylase UbiE
MTWEEAVLWLKAQPDQQNLVRACYFDDPLLEAAQRFEESEEWQAVCQVLEPWMPGRVLDLGAGNGISSYAFARSGCRVTAIDPDPSWIVGIRATQRLCREANVSMDLVQTVAERIPLKDGIFDIVYGRQMLHHAADLKQLCREVARVLCPGGLFIALREHVISRMEDLPLFLKSHPLHGLYGGENAFLLQEYYQAIREAGLRVQRVYGPYESAINFFPMTCLETQEKLHALLGRYLGQCLARWLSHRDRIRSLAGWCHSVRDRTPGRLYSFVAVK